MYLRIGERTMLSFDQILPAISSLTELYNRPTFNAKTASQNQKVALVLRKKIASSFLRLASRENEEHAQEILLFIQGQLNNLILLSSVGIDFKHMIGEHFDGFKEHKDHLSFFKDLKKKKDRSGNTYLSYFFLGTEIPQTDQKEAFKDLYKKAQKETAKSMQYLIRGIKQIMRDEHDSLNPDFIGGDPTSEVISDILMFSLTGKYGDAEDEEIIEHSELRKKMNTKSVFGTIYNRSLSFRKEALKAEADGTLVTGKGKFSWANKSMRILKDCTQFKYRVAKVAEQRLNQAYASYTPPGEDQQEAFEARVSEFQTQLVEQQATEEDLRDTVERRESLAQSRDAWNDDPNDEAAHESYLYSVVDMIKSNKPSALDLRNLLDGIEVITKGNSSLYKKLQSLAYEGLFKRGALTNFEVQYLDGVYSQSELDSAVRKHQRLLKDVARNFRTDHAEIKKGATAENLLVGINGIETDLSDVVEYVEELKDLFVRTPNKIIILSNVAIAEATASNIPLLNDYIDKVEAKLQILSDPTVTEVLTNQEDQAEFKDSLATIKQKMKELGVLMSDGLKMLSTKEILKVEESTSTWTGSSILEGAHPLMSFSIADYPKLTKADITSGVAGVGAKLSVGSKELRVFDTITRSLSTNSDFSASFEKVEEKREFSNGLLEVVRRMSEFKPLKSITKTTEKVDTKSNKEASEFLIEEIDWWIGQRDSLPIEDDEQAVIDEIKDACSLTGGKVKYASSTDLKREANRLIGLIQDHYDVQFKASMKKLYENNMDQAVNSILQETIEEKLTWEQRKGKSVPVHRARSSRALANLNQTSSFLDDETISRENLKKGKKSKKDHLKDAQAEAVRVQQKAIEAIGTQAFDTIVKEKGLSFDGDGVLTLKDTKEINALRSVLTAVRKKQQEDKLEGLKAKAKAMTEKQIIADGEKAYKGLQTVIDGLTPGLKADALSTLNDLNGLLEGGFLNKAKRMRGDFIDLLPSGSRSKANKLIDDLQEALTLQNVYTFEDRLGDQIKEEVEAEINELKKEKEKKRRSLETLKANGTATDEQLEELRLIDGDADEDSRKISRKRNLQRRRISDAKSKAVKDRDSKYVQYAPVVEAEEEAILQSARTAIESSVEQNVSFNSLGLGEEDDFGRGIIKTKTDTKTGQTYSAYTANQQNKNKGVASRTRSLRKFIALKSKYGEQKAFRNLVKKSRDLRPLISVIEASPECFPSVDLSNDYGLLKLYLALPSYASNVLLDIDGNPYTMKAQNVLQDPLYENNLQALVRYLLATLNPIAHSHGGEDVLGEYVSLPSFEANPQLEDFYKQFLESPASSSFIANMDTAKEAVGQVEGDESAEVRKKLTGIYETFMDSKYSRADGVKLRNIVLKKDDGQSLTKDEQKLYTEMEEYFKNLGVGVVEISNAFDYIVNTMEVEDEYLKGALTGAAPLRDLLGANLASHLTSSEVTGLTNAITKTKDKSLVSRDILSENYKIPVTASSVINYTGLIADLSVLLICTTGVITPQEMAENNVDVDCVEKIKEIFSQELEGIKRALLK